MKKFNKIGLGGTFDRLHSGHKLFIDIAAHYSQIIHIGMVSDSYLEKKPKKYNKMIQSYETRKEMIKKYLITREVTFIFSEIKTPGMDRQLALKSDLNALITSQETLLGSIEVNNLRSKKDKSKLTIIITPNVIRKTGILESSTQLRAEDQLKISP